MAGITAAQVKALRDNTGLPMMECKTALTEAHGDTEQARTILQKKFRGKMASRAANVTGEGRIGIHIADDKRRGAIIDLRCETAPVAKTDQFIALAACIAETVSGQDKEVLGADDTLALASVTSPGRSIGDEIAEVFGLLRENIKLHACRKLTGAYLCGYVHHDGKSGVLLALDAVPQSDKNVGADLCMHALFTNPLSIDRNGVPAEQVEKVRSEAIELAKEQNKPEPIVEKIAAGKVNAFFAERVLMEQIHVKTDDYGKTRIADCLKQAGVSAVTDLVVMKVGG